eukprot:1146622-Pelagomonas_calceolata.AAC.1
MVRLSTPPCSAHKQTQGGRQCKRTGGKTGCWWPTWMTEGKRSAMLQKQKRNKGRCATTCTRTVVKRIWPASVDLPASMCPMNTKFRCSLQVHQRVSATNYLAQHAQSARIPGCRPVIPCPSLAQHARMWPALLTAVLLPQ